MSKTATLPAAACANEIDFLHAASAPSVSGSIYYSVNNVFHTSYGRVLGIRNASTRVNT